MAEPAPALRLLQDGTWLHEGTPVRHARLAALLHRSIARDEAGDLMVTTGRDRLPIACDDAPFRVRTVRREGERWWLVLSDDSEEELRPAATVVFDDEGRVRSRVKGDRFWALWSRGATQALLGAVDDDQRVPVAGGSVDLAPAPATPDWRG